MSVEGKTAENKYLEQQKWKEKIVNVVFFDLSPTDCCCAPSASLSHSVRTDWCVQDSTDAVWSHAVLQENADAQLLLQYTR